MEKMEKIEKIEKIDKIVEKHKGVSQARELGNGKILISRQDVGAITVGILSFFLGRVILFNILNPLIIAFLANFLVTSPFFYVGAVFATLGLLTKLSGLYLVKYVVAIVLMGVLNFVFKARKVKFDIMLKACCGGFAVFFSGVVYGFMSGLEMYLILIALLEGVLAGFLTYILQSATKVLTGTRKQKVINNEDMVSLSILIGAILAGVSDISISYVSLRLFVGTLIVLIVGYKGTSALSASVGLLIGFMQYALGFGDVYAIVIYAIGGLSAGIFKDKNKIYTSLAFALATVAISYYFTGELISKQMVYSQGTAMIAFMLMPSQFYFNINTAINPTIDNAKSYIGRVKEITTDKLNAFSNAFYKLSKAFSTETDKRTNLNQEDVSKLIEEISAKTCVGCVKYEQCWKTNFYDTYQTIFSMIGACERKGHIDGKDIPQIFLETCINVNQFINASNKLYEFAKINLTWHNRTLESRELVREQLVGVSGIIKELAEDLDLYINFKEDVEATIIAELTNNRIDFDSVIVLENKMGKLEVTITHKSCYGRKHCTKDIAPVLFKTLGRKMKPLNLDCANKKSECSVTFVEEQKYKLVTGVARAQKAKSDRSGDSFSFMKLNNGEHLLALSDGMGSGKAAALQSQTAIELLEDFIESGFEKEMAVRMINSALVLKSNEESFSTLDICAIDLFSCQAEFIKIGAAATFILRNRTVQTVKSTSLPIGILNNVDIEISVKLLKPNDIIVMITDGLSEIPEGGGDSWIAEELANMNSTNPSEIADYLLYTANKMSYGENKDDMTVLVAKIVG